MSLPHPSTVPPQVAPVEADSMAASGEAVLLDVREQGEYAAGHAPGAVWLPLIALAAGAEPPAAGRTVLAICRSGNRSQRAVDLLAARGVTAVNVTGGMHAWAEAGLPVVTAEGADGQVI
ncbi:rhodanese-like domain-containing protein [Kitasatospora sp. NPDC127111]|uniref:rhodanese-like domain-containing protein n=1 Tax=Kitasatospora sp. NPDC127111 TaxID=3345363 RepID=UPI00362FC32F